MSAFSDHIRVLVLGDSLDLITKMPLFGKASKSPVELVRVLKESLVILEKGADGKKQGWSQFWNLDFNTEFFPPLK